MPDVVVRFVNHIDEPGYLAKGIRHITKRDKDLPDAVGGGVIGHSDDAEVRAVGTEDAELRPPEVNFDIVTVGQGLDVIGITLHCCIEIKLFGASVLEKLEQSVGAVGIVYQEQYLLPQLFVWTPFIINLDKVTAFAAPDLDITNVCKIKLQAELNTLAVENKRNDARDNHKGYRHGRNPYYKHLLNLGHFVFLRRFPFRFSV